MAYFRNLSETTSISHVPLECPATRHQYLHIDSCILQDIDDLFFRAIMTDGLGRAKLGSSVWNGFPRIGQFCDCGRPVSKKMTNINSFFVNIITKYKQWPKVRRSSHLDYLLVHIPVFLGILDNNLPRIFLQHMTNSLQYMHNSKHVPVDLL